VAERDLTSEPMTPDGLNLRQTLFVEAYLGDARGNGVAAARLAGYSGSANILAQTAHQLLAHPEVSSRIRARVEQTKR
jgi:phage terminase small subunit